MKKIGIITIDDNNNYGNRLQNYALSITLKKINTYPITIRNKVNRKQGLSLISIMKKLPKKIFSKISKLKLRKKITERRKFFKDFNSNIEFTDYVISEINIPIELKRKIDYYIVGSDQIWNPNLKRLTKIDLLDFTENCRKISYAASFGIDRLPEIIIPYVSRQLTSFKKISVREDSGKKIVEELTDRKDVEVLIDPSMLLSASEWNSVTKKPKKLVEEKYILCYFLGEKSCEWRDEINKISKAHNCKIINILDPKDTFYTTGPSEFLYLEKNAFLICTDSFHSSVFAILFQTPFIVFDRVTKAKEKTNSRIDTLLSKFKLEDRRFNGKITSDLLKCDYSEAHKILEVERKKSIDFLKDALDIKE